MKIKCPCCEHLTIEEELDICPVCFWENDPVMSQEDWLDIPVGANKVSLNEGKKNYLLFGACEKEMLQHVRKPLGNE